MRRVHRDETGAMAVVVALMTVVLFAMAAVGVELTDMYAKDRASQTTADLSAMAGAQGLPSSCAAFNTARDNLNASLLGSPVDQANGIRDSRGREDDELTSAQMSDRNLANGEIQVLTQFTVGDVPQAANTAVWLSTTACEANPAGGTAAARFVRVLTPQRTTDFTFVLALPSDPANPVPTSGDVQSVATAAVRSPGFGDNIPFFLPSVCTFGAQYVLTDSPSAGASGGSTPNFTPNGATPTEAAPVIDSVTSSVVSGGRVTAVLATVSGLTTTPSLTSTIFDFHTGSGGSTVRWPVIVKSNPPTGVTPARLVSSTTVAPFSAVYELTLNDFIVSRGGSWFVRANETVGVNAGRYTRTGNARTFSVEASPAAGCGDPSTGDFGYLRADRDDSNNFELARNIIEGLDFSVTEIPVKPAVDTPCTGVDSPTTARPSTTNPTTDSANCLAIESGGNRGPVTSGLLTGIGGLNGRLFAASPPTPPGPCTEPAGAADQRRGNTPGDFVWRTPTSPAAVPIWNTKLSCYLVGGGSLSKLKTCDSCLNAAIIDDPRYFVVPVLNTSGRPPSSTQWPVRQFVGAFITNENVGSAATCTDDDDCNGIKFNNGDQTIFSLQTFIFPLKALPDEVRQTTGDGTEYTGIGPRDFLLVE